MSEGESDSKGGTIEREREVRGGAAPLRTEGVSHEERLCFEREREK